MQNTVERCIILCRKSLIEPSDLSLLAPRSGGSELDPQIPDHGISLEEVERTYIIKALEKAGQNRSKAARLLKIPRHVLLYRIEKYKL